MVNFREVKDWFQTEINLYGNFEAWRKWDVEKITKRHQSLVNAHLSVSFMAKSFYNYFCERSLHKQVEMLKMNQRFFTCSSGNVVKQWFLWLERSLFRESLTCRDCVARQPGDIASLKSLDTSAPVRRPSHGPSGFQTLLCFLTALRVLLLSCPQRMPIEKIRIS